MDMDMDSNDYKIARTRRKLIIVEKFSNKKKKGACRKLYLCTSCSSFLYFLLKVFRLPIYWLSLYRVLCFKWQWGRPN